MRIGSIAVFGILCLLAGCASHGTKQSAESQRTVPTPEALEQLIIQPESFPEKMPEPIPLKTAAENRSIWERISAGMRFSANVDHGEVEKYLEWYKNNQSYFDKVTDRGARYLHYIVGELDKHDLPLELALLPIVESAYNPFAYSHSGAAGIWQFIPSTGRHYGLKRDWWYEGRRDVMDSTEAAIAYLSYLNEIFEGDWLLSLAAYNSGQGNVLRAIKRNRQSGKKTDFWSLRLPRETRAYVPQLLAVSKIVSNPEKYGIALPGLADEPYFEVVAIEQQIDLAQASNFAGISVEEMYQLNAGYNRWVTPPDGPHRLLLPVASTDTFKTRLAETPADQWRPVSEYVVRRGDTLGRIARIHKVTLAELKQVNRLPSDLIRSGQRLKIPGSGITNNQPLPFLAMATSVHKVRSGESLWTIARKYQVSMYDLMRWNGLDKRSILRPGQKLTVRAVGAGTASSGKNIDYRVKKGDSLYRIARKFKVRIADILAWNNLSNRDFIKPGQKLTLYPTN